MLDKKLTTAALEDVYDLIAQGVDQAGEANAKLFLAKLSLSLANLLDDPAAIRQAVEAALRDLG